MGRNRLRHQEALCRQHLGTLDAMVDWRAIASVQQLCHVLATQRQRPIYLESGPFPPPLAGLWVGTPHTDFIFYAADAPPLLQEHAVLHEIAHMLLGTRAQCPPTDLGPWEEELTSRPLTLERIRGAMSQPCYDEDQERMAELLATLIELRWRAAHQQPHGWPARSGERRPELRWLAEHFTGAL